MSRLVNSYSDFEYIKHEWLHPFYYMVNNNLLTEKPSVS